MGKDEKRIITSKHFSRELIEKMCADVKKNTKPKSETKPA